MAVIKNISESTVNKVTRVMVFMALFALPWINRMHLTTFLFVGLFVLLLTQRVRKIDMSWFSRQWIFILFFAYYVLQIIVLCIYPHDHWNNAAVAQKASLVAMPFLFYMICIPDKGLWKTAIRGFVLGNVFAAVCCLMYAVFHYQSTHNSAVFFYHTYAGFTGMN